MLTSDVLVVCIASSQPRGAFGQSRAESAVQYRRQALWRLPGCGTTRNACMLDGRADSLLGGSSLNASRIAARRDEGVGHR